VKELGQVRSHHVPKIFPARLLFFFAHSQHHEFVATPCSSIMSCTGVRVFWPVHRPGLL